MPDSLESLREKFDDVDRKLLELLAERRDLSVRTAQVKATQGGEAYDPQRHQKVIDGRIAQGLELGLPASFTRSFMDLVLTDSVNLQRDTLGGRGVPSNAELHITE